MTPMEYWNEWMKDESAKWQDVAKEQYDMSLRLSQENERLKRDLESCLRTAQVNYSLYRDQFNRRRELEAQNQRLLEREKQQRMPGEDPEDQCKCPSCESMRDELA